MKYHINPDNSIDDSLTFYTNSSSLHYNSVSGFGFYDTIVHNNVKFLCIKSNQIVQCRHLQILINEDEGTYDYYLKGDENIKFELTNDFKEKDCYYSLLSYDLFCCALEDYIQCFRIYSYIFYKYNEFKIKISGINSYLTIKSFNNYAIFVFMNNHNDINSVYEYYIYPPTCKNREYIILNNSLNENKPEEEFEKLSNLFDIKTNKYYFSLYNNYGELGYFTLNGQKFNGKTLINDNDYKFDYIVTKRDKYSRSSIKVNYYVSVEGEDAYMTYCKIKLIFKYCYNSCEICTLDINDSNDEEHNCLECKSGYYSSPEKESNCYTLKEKKENWYLDSPRLRYGFCHDKCHSCTGPNNNDCLSCKNGLYLDNNTCKNSCSQGSFPIEEAIDSDHYFKCIKCYQNCKTCLKEGNEKEMNCETCKDNKIKYNDNCYEIDNFSIKSFYIEKNNQNYITSCYKEFGLFIKEDSNECINLTNKDEGYYISNPETGLLSKCHNNCFSCKYGPIIDVPETIQSMECLECKDKDDINKEMIKVHNNCFKILIYTDKKIVFNISEMNLGNNSGNCTYFGKAIYYQQYECIDKPTNTYYVLNDENENTGVIKNCHEACNTCYGEGNNQNSNCIECAQGYIKTGDSDTHCLKNDTISTDYYLNKTDNRYYRCFHSCKGCYGSYNHITNEMYCLECIDGYFFIYGENNCYDSTLLEQNKYYFNSNDSKFHKCYYTCSECLNFEPNEENHYCKNCEENYYKLENGLYPNNCYDNETINLLNNIKVSNIINNNSGNICLNNQFITPDGDCVLTCLNGTFQFSLNKSCLYSCPYNYEIINNKCVLKEFDSETIAEDFINEISNDVVSYVNSSKVINGSNFLAIVLSSDNMNSEEQLKNGISSVDLGNCTNVIKEYYNISQEENIIVLNMETKNNKSKMNESIINEDKSFDLGKNTQLEIFDFSGRKLNISVCKEDIKIMKYFGDVEKQLNMDSAKSLSKQGVDVFNKNDAFFNDICHPYENSDGKDIILSDRRNEIYQDVTFCQNGCTYNGINYNLKAANCICNSIYLQEENTQNNEKEKKINNFETLTESFIASFVSLNFGIIRCYNLALNIKILIYNIGFYCLLFMFILQIIFFCVYLIKKLNPLKNFMLIFNINNKKNNFNNNKNKSNKINQKLYYPPKKKSNKSIININNEKKNSYKLKKLVNQKLNDKQKTKLKNKEDIIMNTHKKTIFKKKMVKTNCYSRLNKSKINKNSGNVINSKKNFLISNNSIPKFNNETSTININRNYIKGTNFSKFNDNNKIRKIKAKKRKPIIKGKFIKKNHIMETLKDSSDNNIIYSSINKKDIIHISKMNSIVQDLNYKEAIIYDKRSYLKIFWGFLIDSQIILGTFCTDNHLDLFVIKLSFLVCTFQISFFLNALFYTDEYISNAYHNDGELSFSSGLPKSIYSFIATLITTNLLRMLSSSKNELIRVIRRNEKFYNYANVIRIKLAKLRKKLIIYFILIFLLDSFSLYYVTVFCSVYRNSQKYWFLGCLESLGIDSLTALVVCIFLALFRYISIKRRRILLILLDINYI